MEARVLTLSVNPSQSTLGYLNPEATLRRIRTLEKNSVLKQINEQSGKRLRLIFGPVATSAHMGKILLMIRTLFAAILIVHGVMSPSSIGTIAAFAGGTMLALGLFTRPVMLACAGLYGLTTLLELGMGNFDQMGLMLTGICLAMAFTSAGRYSFDALLRRNIFRGMKRRAMQRMEKDALTYKAYHRFA